MEKNHLSYRFTHTWYETVANCSLTMMMMWCVVRCIVCTHICLLFFIKFEVKIRPTYKQKKINYMVLRSNEWIFCDLFYGNKHTVDKFTTMSHKRVEQNEVVISLLIWVIICQIDDVLQALKIIKLWSKSTSQCLQKNTWQEYLNLYVYVEVCYCYKYICK